MGYFAIAVLILAGVYFFAIFNRLVALKNQVTNAFAQIDVQLKRRYDLIPNLVEVAKGYMAHERETLEAVISARNRAQAVQSTGSIDNADKLLQADAQVNQALSRLIALSENYPDLKANTQMMALMEELSSTENRVAASRQQYNDSATFYNTYQEQIPNSWVAGMGNHKKIPMLDVIVNAVEREAPKVAFK